MADGSGEIESWLRGAARVPAALPQVCLPQPGELVGEKYRIEARVKRFAQA